MIKVWIYHDSKLRSVDADRVRPSGDDGRARFLPRGTWEESDEVDRAIAMYRGLSAGSRTRCRWTVVDYGATKDECLERVNSWVFKRIATLEAEIAEVRSRLVTEESIAAAQAARKAAK